MRNAGETYDFKDTGTMIKLITDTDIMHDNMLHQDYYGRKILSYYNSYGLKYDFCRFYQISENEMRGFIVRFNSVMIIASGGDLPVNEIIHFILMNNPFRVEAPWNVLSHLGNISGYKMLGRTKFEFTDHMPEEFDINKLDRSPKLDDIYEILHQGFPTLIEHGLWVTEHSHKIRHGLSEIFLYNNCTTATVIYDIDDHVLIGQVATRIEARGKGYARELLYWIGHTLSQSKKTVSLFALDYRASFYREIGFRPVSTENVIQAE